MELAVATMWAKFIRTILTAALVAVGVLAMSAGSAAAGWSASGTGSVGSASQALPAGGTPSVLGFGSLAFVTWSTTSLPSGVVATSYVLQRTNTVDGTTTQVCTTTGTACLEFGVPNGTWLYRVQARLGTWIGPWGAPSAPFQVGPAGPALLAAVAADVPVDPLATIDPAASLDPVAGIDPLAAVAPEDPLATVVFEPPPDPVPMVSEPLPGPVEPDQSAEPDQSVIADAPPDAVVATDPAPSHTIVPTAGTTDPAAPVASDPVPGVINDPVTDPVTDPVADPVTDASATLDGGTVTATAATAAPVVDAGAVTPSTVASPVDAPSAGGF